MQKKASLIAVLLILIVSSILGQAPPFNEEQQRINLSQVRPSDLSLGGARVNMSKVDAKDALGEPAKVEKHPLGEVGYAYWKYPDGSSILFQNENVVSIEGSHGALVWGDKELPSRGMDVDEVYNVLGPPPEFEYGPSSSIDYLTGGKELIQYHHRNGVVDSVSLTVAPHLEPLHH